MLTMVLAIYAAVTATISLGISYLAYKADNPKISGRFYADISSVGDHGIEISLNIELYNRGRAPIAVDYLHAFYGRFLNRTKLFLSSSPDLKFPVLIEGNSNFKKKIEGFASHVAPKVKNGRTAVRVYVMFATGRRMKLKTRARYYGPPYRRR